MAILPTEVVPAKTASPKLLILFSPPKTGKTTLAAGLPSNLIMDLEQGSDFVSALKINVSSASELYEICEQIKKEGKPYKYGTIDTATALEDMCLGTALKLYQQTPMGKTYNGDILSLPNGAGYKYLREAFKIMIDVVRSAFDRVILMGHVKDKAVEKNGKEIVARELDLTGKLSSITCANADAIGYVYREGNKCMVNFQANDNIICGARPLHLRNQVITLSEEQEDKSIKTFWERIYID